MKFLMIFMFLFSMKLSAEEIPAEINNTFVPEGYDSNDESEVFVRGYFTNACFEKPQYKMKKRGNQIGIRVYGEKDPEQVFCPQIIQPFSMKVNIDPLPANDYALVFNPTTDSPRTRTLEIDRGNPGEDEIYANVLDIKVEDDTLFVKAQRPGNCYDFAGIKILDNDQRTYTVLPKLIRNERKWEECKTDPRTRVYKARFRNTLKLERAFFHVRSKREDSYNEIINLR